MSKILFQEKQKFTQWRLWLIILAPTFYIFYAMLSPLLGNIHDKTGNLAISLSMSTESWIAVFILLLILCAMLFLKMTTIIDNEKIVVRHLYFVRKQWYWRDVESAEIIKHRFMGYGIRISLNHSTVYNGKGNQGLFLKLKNGKKRLVGTQKSEKMGRMVETILSEV